MEFLNQIYLLISSFIISMLVICGEVIWILLMETACFILYYSRE